MRPVTIARFVCMFTLLSLVPLSLAVADSEPRDGEAHRALVAVVGGVPQAALGFSYEGAPGQTLLLGQIILVLVSAAAATLARGVAQRTGVVVLVLWAAIWTFSAGHAAVATGRPGFWGAFILTGLWLTLSLLWLAQLCLPRPRVMTHARPLAV